MSWTDTRTYERIRLTGERYVVQHRHMRYDMQRDITDNMVHTLVAKVWSHADTHPFPADWWQALKLRWFPMWALKRWPARMMLLTVLAKYPTIRIAGEDHKAHLEVVQQIWPAKSAKRLGINQVGTASP